MKHAWRTAVILAALVGLGAALPARADTLEEKRDKKLAEEWVKSGGWSIDYEKVREDAKKSGKPIFAYFTRSYSP